MALAATRRQSRHCIFVTHPARQAQRIAHRVCGVAVVPEARSAGARAEVSRMQRKNRGQSAGAVTHQLHQFVIVEIRRSPECSHAR